MVEIVFERILYVTLHMGQQTKNLYALDYTTVGLFQLINLISM